MLNFFSHGNIPTIIVFKVTEIQKKKIITEEKVSVTQKKEAPPKKGTSSYKLYKKMSVF